MPELQWTGERCIPEKMRIENNPQEQKHLDQIFTEHLARYKFAQQFVDKKVVLDAACGSGYGSQMLAEFARLVDGVDVDFDTIEHCKEKRYKDNILYYVCDLEKFFPSKNYDVVVSFETIEHLEDPTLFLNEVSCWCRETFVFSIPLNSPSEFHKQVYNLTQGKDMMLSFFPEADWQIDWFDQFFNEITPLTKEGRFLIGVAKKIIK